MLTTSFNNNYFSILYLWLSYYSHCKQPIISLNSVNRLIFVTVKCGVFFAVRTEFLNIIYMSFSFKALT
jgi:hypothetical protein